MRLGRVLQVPPTLSTAQAIIETKKYINSYSPVSEARKEVANFIEKKTPTLIQHQRFICLSVCLSVCLCQIFSWRHKNPQKSKPFQKTLPLWPSELFLSAHFHHFWFKISHFLTESFIFFCQCLELNGCYTLFYLILHLPWKQKAISRKVHKFGCQSYIFSLFSPFLTHFFTK